MSRGRMEGRAPPPTARESGGRRAFEPRLIRKALAPLDGFGGARVPNLPDAGAGNRTAGRARQPPVPKPARPWLETQLPVQPQGARGPPQVPLCRADDAVREAHTA